jgi:hypothetical protein
MDIESPSTYNCAADQHYEDVSLHIKDSFEGEVYVCGATSKFYAEFYYCGVETGCINNQTLTATECKGFDTDACFIAESIGDFHVYLDGDENGNNLMIYNLGSCPDAPAVTGAGNALVPAFFAVIIVVLAMLL